MSCVAEELLRMAGSAVSVSFTAEPTQFGQSGGLCARRSKMKCFKHHQRLLSRSVAQELSSRTSKQISNDRNFCNYLNGLPRPQTS